MAKKQPEQQAGPVPARALVTDLARGFVCGELVSVDPAELQSLVDAGTVDAHPDAVAHAMAQATKKDAP